MNKYIENGVEKWRYAIKTIKGKNLFNGGNSHMIIILMKKKQNERL